MKVMMYQMIPNERAASCVEMIVEKKKASSVKPVAVSKKKRKYLTHTNQNCQGTFNDQRKPKK